jgi:hypothetical protein
VTVGAGCAARALRGPPRGLRGERRRYPGSRASARGRFRATFMGLLAAARRLGDLMPWEESARSVRGDPRAESLFGGRLAQFADKGVEHLERHLPARVLGPRLGDLPSKLFQISYFRGVHQYASERLAGSSRRNSMLSSDNSKPSAHRMKTLLPRLRASQTDGAATSATMKITDRGAMRASTMPPSCRRTKRSPSVSAPRVAPVR